FLSRADLISTARQQTLPAGVTEILKISSGDQDALMVAQESSRVSQEDVRHAAQFYVQQILFAPDSDHYRVLGVDPDDIEAKIKLHYRLLVRWLHPDKNSSNWEAVFSDRVNRAWHSLRTPERRREYDEQLKSQYSYQPISTEPSRELKPSQLRSNQVNERFISSRTMKRLPIAVFGILGVSAVFALWWLSQLQPNLHAPLVANQEKEQREDSAELPATSVAPETISVDPVQKPLPAIVPIATVEDVPEAAIEMTADEKALVQQEISLPAAITPQAVIKKPDVKPTAVALENKNVLVPATKKKNPPQEKASPRMEASLAKVSVNSESTGTTATQKIKTVKSKTTSMPVIVNTVPAVQPVSAVVSNSPVETKAYTTHDANVKQFLQKFSRVYADGDYFALHNLFTNDLNILSAPSQRNVLRSYRQLFENSQSREISLDHVTWLANEDNIVVIASYQAQVLPRGKAEAQSSRGDIRLDLRMENGQLRIVRLQSDTKNG
ncbi:MAG: DnaJ domain-containing protein, partial [Arenimonas sp.]